MVLSCPKCRSEMVLTQPYPYHAGFGDEGFLYCEDCPAVLTFSSFDPAYVDLVREVHPWMLDTAQQSKVENGLKRCRCGSKFLFRSKPRCPSCGAPLRGSLPEDVHYLILGERIDGQRESVWLEGSSTR